MPTRPLITPRALLTPAEPLWRRVPVRDANGNSLADFMLFIPGLRRASVPEQQRIIDRIGGVLARYASEVVFADLNVAINVLWITVRPRTGVSLEISGAILEQVPHARLVAYQPNRSRRGV